MLEIVLVIVVLICGALALHAGESARRVQQDTKILQDDLRRDVLRLQETTSQQDERIRRLQKVVADLRSEVEQAAEQARAAKAQAPMPAPPDNLPTPRAVRG